MKTIIGVLALLISFVASASAAAPPITLPNDSTTGTALYSLAKLTVNGTAITTATTDVAGAIGIVMGGSGTGGSASIQSSGVWPCNFDPTTVVVGDFVQISSTGAGNCHDAGSSCPSSKQTLGQVVSSTSLPGVYSVNLGVTCGTFGGAIPLGLSLGGTNQTTGASSFWTGSAPTIAASTTNYIAFGGNATTTAISTESNAYSLIAGACTISHLYVSFATTPAASHLPVFTIDDGGSAKAVTCTPTGTATTCSDLTHSFTTTAGDALDVSVVNPASANSTGVINVSFQINC